VNTIPWQTVILAAAIAMAILDFLKDVLPGRYWFHDRLVSSWLKDGLAKSRKADVLQRVDLKEEVTDESAKRELIELATAGRRWSLFSLHIDQLAAQVNAAAESVLDDPAAYPSLLLALTGASPSIVKSRTGPEGARLAHEPDTDLVLFLGLREGFRSAYAEAKERAEKDGRGARGVQAPAGSPVPDSTKTTAGQAAKAEPPSLTRLMEARTRLTNRVQRRIDELQIAGRTSWKLLLQVVALLLGLVLAWWMSDESRIVVGLGAGFLAPILHDLMSRMRQPQTRA
jgi:hypothetical protein